MMMKLARRLGLRPSLAAAVVDGWNLPVASTDAPARLAPLDGVGGGGAAIDNVGRIQPHDAQWSLDWALVAGARWRPAYEAGTVSQKRIGPAVIQTTVKTPEGPIHQRVAAAVVDGKAVLVVEIENASGVAVAVGALLRPLTLDGRGLLSTASVSSAGLIAEGTTAARFLTPPAAVEVSDASQGDLFKHMPAPDAGAVSADVSCRSGASQACAVWPLPHTRTLRYLVELDGATARHAAVPSIEDIERGWATHLDRGLRVSIDDDPLNAAYAPSVARLLSEQPQVHELPATITALAAAGFASHAPRLFDGLDRVPDQASLLTALSRWFRFDQNLVALEQVMPAIAVAASKIEDIAGPVWLRRSLDELARGLTEIGQPDVADRVAQIRVVNATQTPAHEVFASLSSAADARTMWEQGDSSAPARLVLAAKAMVVEDAAAGVDVLPGLPVAWRGRQIDVFNAPVSGGALSYGLRWHGPRAALLWQYQPVTDAPFALIASSIDSGFRTEDHSGETLLADPGWTTT